MKCHFCHQSTEQPIEDGWWPTYWDCAAAREIYGPFCNACQTNVLRLNSETDDFELSCGQKFRLIMEKWS